MYGHDSEPVTLTRDCQAIVVPAGDPVDLKAGELVYITQAMGGSFTIFFEGNLLRIAGSDADALGKEPVRPPVLPEGASDEEFEALVWQQMKTVYDPEIPINIVDLGLIYDCHISKEESGARDLAIRMTVTAPGCGMGEILLEDVRERVANVPTVRKVSVELVFDPPWNQSMMTEAARLEAGLL